MRRAIQAASGADLFIAVGTSLQVYPIAGLLPLAKNAGAPVVIVNGEPTAMHHLADAVIRSPLSEVPPLMCVEPPRC